MKSEFIKTSVKKIIEEHNQEAVPMLFVPDQTGKMTMLPLVASKDLWLDYIKAAVEYFEALEYALVIEAYQAKFAKESEEAKKIMSGEMAVRDLPSDKREDIVTVLHVLNTGKASMDTAIIDKTPEGKRTLQPWETMENVESRFVMPAWKIVEG